MIQVSVVIPVFNGRHFLDLTFSSLRAQTLSPLAFEVIAVDDGSTDHSAELIEEIIKSHPEFNISIVKKKNGGVSSARNEGARRARGEIIGFLDQDAVATPNWLEIGLRKFDNPNISAVEGQIIPTAPYRATALTNILENKTGGRFMTANFFIRKRVFDAIGGFDENFPYYLEDSDLAFTLIRQGFKISWCPDVQITHPYVQKTMKQHVWQMTELAERVPLLLYKHKISRKFCQNHGIPWHTMTACPLYFYGYYLACVIICLTLAWPISIPLKNFFLTLGLLIFSMSYLVTIYARFRNRAILWREVVLFLGWYLVIPYMRIYFLIKGSWKYKVPIRLI